MTVELTTYKMPTAIGPKVIRGATDIIKEHLEEKGFTGNWLATATQQITIRAQVKIRFVRRQEQQLLMRVKPGNNATAWEWLLTPPDPSLAPRVASVLSGERDPEDVRIEDVIPAETVTEPTAETEAPTTPANNEQAADIALSQESEDEAAANLPPIVHSLPSRLAHAEKKAEGYKKRLQRIEDLRTEVQRLMQEADQREEEAKKLEEEAGNDVTGKAAYDALVTISQLLDIGK